MRGAPAIVASGLLLASALSACDDSTAPLVTVDEPPDGGCIRDQEPRSYDVYFVVDVSGSMGPFLDDLKNALVTLASSFKTRDPEGHRVRVDYYFIGFVEDVEMFGGGRMTSPISVAAAVDEAVQAGAGGKNLLHDVANIGDENMLDALAMVLALNPNAEAKLVLVAGDTDPPEAPAVLAHVIPVQTKYADLFAAYKAQGMRVHAFVTGPIDGLSRPYGDANQPALTTLPGSEVHEIRDLEHATEDIKKTLSFIAREAACN